MVDWVKRGKHASQFIRLQLRAKVKQVGEVVAPDGRSKQNQPLVSAFLPVSLSVTLSQLTHSLCLFLTAAVGICPPSYFVPLLLSLHRPALPLLCGGPQSQSVTLTVTCIDGSVLVTFAAFQRSTPSSTPLDPPTTSPLLPHSVTSQHGLQHGRHSERYAPSPRGLEAGCSRATQRHPERH